ncbi:MAG TPA: ABC transporter permease [Clostridia bacterium]|nr:ABC transporter permease [Clostridia bacterium]
MSIAIKRAFELMFSGNDMLQEIVFTTLRMALSSSLLALLIGVPIGLLIATNNFPGKKAVVTLLRTFMGFPPVVVGIIVYVMFSGTGPFGRLQLIYSVELMIIAQVILITPIVAGMTQTSASAICDQLLDTCKGLNLNRGKVLVLTLVECKFQIIAVYLFAFARAMSEVGAIQIVGGNILHKTRVMTTTIALNYNTGEFSYAIALGIILMLIVVAVNLSASILQRGNEK